jgi:WD40 repeat protein
VAVAFSRDGRRLLTAGKGEARVWDAQTFKPVTGPLRHGQELVTAALSPDGSKVLTAGGNEVQLWDAATGGVLYMLKHAGYVRCACFSPDGSRVLSGGDDKFARVWDVSTGTQLVGREHPAAVYQVDFAGRGDGLLALTVIQYPPVRGFIFQAARVWSAATGRDVIDPVSVKIWPYKTAERRRPAALSPDGNRLVVRDEWGLVAYDVRTGEQVAEEHTHCNDAWAHKPPFPNVGPHDWIVFSADGSKYLTAGISGRVLVWDAAKHRLADMGALAPDPNSAYTDGTEADAGSFSLDGRRLLLLRVSLSHVRPDSVAARVVDLATGRPVLDLWQAKGSYTAGTFSPDGRRVAVGFAADGWTGVYELPPPPPPDGKP